MGRGSRGFGNNLFFERGNGGELMGEFREVETAVFGEVFALNTFEESLGYFATMNSQIGEEVASFAVL